MQLKTTLANTVMIVRAFQKQSESEASRDAMIRALAGWNDETTRAIRQSLNGHVCVYCRSRLADHADHTLPIEWIRFGALIKYDVTNVELNGRPICLVCDNAKHVREFQYATRIRNALKRKALKYVRALLREFLANENKLMRKFARWNKQRAAKALAPRQMQANAARHINLLFAAFRVVRRGAGHKAWGEKIANLTPNQIKRGFDNLSRVDMPNATRDEYQNMFAVTGNVLTIFRAALETQTLLRRANDEATLRNVQACIKARAAYFAALAENKLTTQNWRAKAPIATMAAIEKLWIAFVEMRDTYLKGSKWYD